MARQHLLRPLNLAIGALLLVGIALPVTLWIRVHRGIEKARPDDPKPTAAELAQISVDTSQYLVTLATAVFALVGFLFVAKDSPFQERLSASNREALVIGSLFLACSLLTGFSIHLTTLETAADAVVRASLGIVLWLQLSQAIELLLGVALVGAAIVSALFRSRSSAM